MSLSFVKALLICGIKGGADNVFHANEDDVNDDAKM